MDMNEALVGGVDYRKYHFKLKDWLELIGLLIGKGLVVSYLFYDSLAMAWIILPLAIVEYGLMNKKKLEKQKRELMLAFRDLLESIITALCAGYSLEQSFIESRKEYVLLYGDKAVLSEELELIVSGLKMNIPIDALIKNFADRSGLEDVKDFSNIVIVAQKSGGNLVRIMRKTVSVISDKILVEEEIKTMIAAKIFEGKIMMIMPYGMLLYLKISNGELLASMYHNTIGIVVMSIFLLLIYIAEFWVRRITEIKV